MVAVSTLIVIVLNLILGLIIPAVLYIITKKRFGKNLAAFFTGCAIMFVFAFVVESMVHSLILNGNLRTVITGNIWLYALYGGAMAAIFEETGRLTAFHVFLKKYRDNDGTALIYGAGHGGFEAFYILFVSGINNLILAIAVNSGNAAALTAGLSGDALLQTEAVILQIQNISWFVFLLSPVERIAAIILHLSLSVFVWFAVKEKKYQFFGLALLLHFLLDAVTVLLNQMLTRFGIPGMVFTEIAVWVMALGAAALAVKVWKAHKTETVEGISKL